MKAGRRTKGKLREVKISLLSRSDNVAAELKSEIREVDRVAATNVYMFDLRCQRLGASYTG